MYYSLGATGKRARRVPKRLGNAADAEDAVQDEALRRLLGCFQSSGKGKRLGNQR
jgi:hypothetical protein